MKKRFLFIGLLTAIFAFTACDDNDSLLPDEEDITDDVIEDKYDGRLTLEDLKDTTITVYASDVEGDSLYIYTTFITNDKKMRRLYMTENVTQSGVNPYKLDKKLLDLDVKGDGSLDIESKQGDEFTFVLPFPKYDTSVLTEGTVEYTLWATNGRGDYRDASNSLAVGIGTIVVDYDGENPATVVKEYSAKLLAAPLADGTSETFISLFDGAVYKLSEGKEYAAFWDFGYYYGGTHKASLASTYDYPSFFDHDDNPDTKAVGIATLTETSQDSLNHCFFTLSDVTSTEFDAIEKAMDLDYISTPSSEKINHLEAGNIIEFVDNYGKKGLIKVTEIELGTNDLGYGSGAYININIKVQP